MTTMRTSPDEKSVVVQPPDKLAALKQLQQTADEYINKERTRLQNEASSLKAILSGRTGGKGVQSNSTRMVAAVAYKDLQAYVEGL